MSSEKEIIPPINPVAAGLAVAGGELEKLGEQVNNSGLVNLGRQMQNKAEELDPDPLLREN